MKATPEIIILRENKKKIMLSFLKQTNKSTKKVLKLIIY